MARILHIVVGLGAGGAEHTLYRLISADAQNTHCVVSLTDGGVFGPLLVADGVEVHAIGMSKARPGLKDVLALGRVVRAIDPEIVQTWMYHADLVGGCVARLLGKRAVIWGIRNGCMETTAHSHRTRMVARACAALSRFVPASIVSCSKNTVECHVAMGYAREKMVVVPNGYDMARLKPDAAARDRVRASLGLAAETIVLGMVARWNPAKDHATLASALARVAGSMRVPWVCVLAGHGMSDDNGDVVGLLERNGVRDRVRLLGERRDIGDIMNTLDLHLLSSILEAFPNVVAEAMACGTPCVVTRVGDAEEIVADTGWVVEARDSLSFSNAILEAVREMGHPVAWRARCNAARRRVVDNFGLDRMVSAYQDVWATAAWGGR